MPKKEEIEHGREIVVRGRARRERPGDLGHAVGHQHGVQVVPVDQRGSDVMTFQARGNVWGQRAIRPEEEDLSARDGQSVAEGGRE